MTTDSQGYRRRGRPLEAMASTQVTEFEPEQAAAAAPAELVGTVTLLSAPNPGATYPLDHGELVIGRSPDVSLYIDDAGLSRRHARIYRQGRDYFVEDLDSTNGTIVGSERVERPTQLADGARVLVGKSTILRFSIQDRLEVEAARQVYEQTVRDGLTGLYNRRYLEDRLKTEFAYAQRHGSPLCVLVIDADHFKRINDTHGHPAGDAVLRTLGSMLENATRVEDIAARYGGEEFVIMARDVGLDGGSALAERVRAQVERTPVLFGALSIPVTVSIGVAATDRGSHCSPEGLVAAADSALYRAKTGGRNRCARAD